MEVQGESPTPDSLDEDRIVRHIVVIGFHHKHGYQIDYCYPPLVPNGPVFSSPTKPICLPSCWKTLPLLCLPDGSHNHDSDTIYFTMPGIQQDNSKLTNEENSSNHTDESARRGIKTIFGTACYRQIQADKLLNRTDDMTRVAVQKSVCVLSTKPLFGLIRSKLEMITHAYFEELDFSKVKILKLTYDNLNSLLSRDSVKENATFLGLSARHLVSQFGNNVLVLFKAMLLEKRILFYKSPVRDLCSTIMSMCTLFTGLLECGGLDYSTCDLQLSPSLLEALKLSTSESLNENNSDNSQKGPSTREDKVLFKSENDEIVIVKSDSKTDIGEPIQSLDLRAVQDGRENLKESQTSAIDVDETVTNVGEQTGEYEVIVDPEDAVSLADGSVVDDPYALRLCRMKPEECGLPLQIFTHGSFCLPYLSISYLDLIFDSRVKSFVIGATNFLFKQRREMYDVIVDMEENTITINDSSLKKCLSLTTEDLRFMDYLNRHVKLENNQPKDEFDLISHDITKWVGGDEWIRYHFKLYTIYLLKNSKSMNFDAFNSNFVQAWKQSTNNYKIWDSANKSSVLDGLQDRHPFSSTTKGLNFSDMKLKLSHAINSSEKGRMINQTLNGIGKWSIWNNIASAASTAAATATNSLATSATTQSNSSSTTHSISNPPSSYLQDDKSNVHKSSLVDL